MEVIEQQASRVASLTLELVAGCQEEEERLASRFKTSVPEIRTLRMFVHEQQLTVKALLGGMGISGSRLSRILESLEEKGYVTRSIDPEDRRSIDVCLTSKGSDLVRTLEEQYLQVHKKLLEDIPESLHGPLAEGVHRQRDGGDEQGEGDDDGGVLGGVDPGHGREGRDRVDPGADPAGEDDGPAVVVGGRRAPRVAAHGAAGVSVEASPRARGSSRRARAS